MNEKRILDTKEIVEELFYIINTSTKELIIVSPYIQLTRWNELYKAIDKALERGVPITFISRERDRYYRKDSMKILDEFRKKGCSVFIVPDLHAKIYCNDERALITSMNLYRASTEKSKEIGVLITNEKNVKDTKEIISQIIKQNVKKSIEGKRIVSKVKAPSGLQQTEFKVTTEKDKYYTVKLVNGYSARIGKDESKNQWKIGKSYTCKAVHQWASFGSRKVLYLNDIGEIKEI